MASLFDPFPYLETPRLRLRPLLPTDWEAIVALRGNPESMRFIPRPIISDKASALTMVEMIQQKVDEGTGINWVITEKEADEMLGIIGHYRIKPEHFRSEIGYMLLPKAQGKGYALEAVQAMLIYGFEQLHFHSVEAVIDPENEASIKVIEKLGFVKEAHFIENEYFNGRFWDALVYSLLKRNFKPIV
ncbi:GNAT family N-acetyltransferase [Flavobacterium sp.]|jgi:ribosomal-protein-alanine N-acetyltransferase|uniref:GNAT family N-acetyltransferase n=1 Tax=Flavobacterium sp. TaxID=239 RepID=UPI0022CB96CC|nr:GNAT family N-acetyltransferase [Flavobacterium sp.]MCZ8146009.1 GNAT family N-acetyltransferase [Flavobacterium sp.]MCZ8367228.1 GNAT family N-acetyltransferase [Flavobacterium sp.]